MTKNQKKEIFDKVYREWVQSLFNFLYYKCGDKATAEDLTQEVFVKYWHKIESVNLKKVKSYLFTTAKNLVINQIAHQNVVLRFQSNFKPSTTPESPQFLMEVKEFNERLQNAINELTEGEREVFLMSRIDGFKYREIAEMLNVSQKAVEKRMHKALLKLRKICNRI